MEIAPHKRIYQRAWFWLLFVVSSIMLLIMLAWYVPPRLWPEWTIKHSPFWEQKLMTIRCPDVHGMSENELVKSRIFNSYLSDVSDHNADLIADELESLSAKEAELLLKSWVKKLAQSPDAFSYSVYRVIYAIDYGSSISWELRQNLRKTAEERVWKSYLYNRINYHFSHTSDFEDFPTDLQELMHKQAALGDLLGLTAQLSSTPVLHMLKETQLDNGSWKNDPRITALAILNYLGAGYDHQVPGQYKQVIQRGIEYLGEQDWDTLEFEAKAWYAMCFGEVYAMTLDPRLKRYCNTGALWIKETIKSRNGQRLQLDDGPLAMAFKAHKAAGTMSLSGKFWNLRGLSVLPYDGTNKRLKIIEGLVRVFSGMDPEDIIQLQSDYISTFNASQGRLRAIDIKYLYFLHLTTFRDGGQSYLEYQGWFREYFCRLRTFSFDSDGVYKNCLSDLFDSEHKLESSLYLELMTEIEYRYIRVSR